MSLPFDEPATNREHNLSTRTRIRRIEDDPIVLTEHAFSEFLTAIVGEADKPSEKLLAAVVAYKKHEPVTKNIQGRTVKLHSS